MLLLPFGAAALRDVANAAAPARATWSQVAVLGAAGGIGQPLSLLLKMNPLVSQLSLYDIANTPGVAADLSHCNTPAQVRCRARRCAPAAPEPPAAPRRKPSNCHCALAAARSPPPAVCAGGWLRRP
jgi:hypothetical protein